MNPREELSSVRVEVEGGVESMSDAPNFEAAQPHGSSTVAAAIGLLVLVAVTVTLVALQPDRGEPSNEVSRPPDAALPADDRGETPSDRDLDPATPSNGERPALRPINLQLDWEIDSIVATATGFFALERADEATTRPSIFASVDGRDWMPVETDVLVPDEVGEERYVWSHLSTTDDGFAITARLFESVQSELFLSGDARTWRLVSGFGSISEAPTVPVLVDGESVFGMTRVGDQTLNGVIAGHTNLGDGSRVNICENFAETDSLLLVTCTGELLRLSAENVVSDRSAEEVLQCVQRLVRVGFGATPVSGSILDLQTGLVTPTLPVAGAYDLSEARPRSGPLALLDFGVIDEDVRTGPSDPVLPDDVCDGIADVPTRSEPAVVLIEPDIWTNGFRRLPFPNDGISTNPANVSVIGVLESSPLPSAFVPQQHVVVQRPGGAVWLADSQTREWMLVGGENRLGRELVAIAETVERVYQINADELTAFDIAFGDDRSVEIDQISAPLGGLFRGLDRILFANRDLLFFTDATGTWLVDTSVLGEQAGLDAIVPSRIAPNSQTSVIVADDEGLLGLAQAGPSRLRFLRSIDGLDWVDVDATISSGGVEVSNEYFWFGLEQTETGFAMWGSLDDANELTAQQVDLFTSSDGANWEQVDGFGSLGNEPSITIPSVVDEEWIVGRQFSGDSELTQILVDHTNIEIPEVGVCGVEREAVVLRAFSCLGDEIAITADNVISNVSPAQVLNCIGTLVFTNSFSTTTLTVFDRATGELRRLDEPVTGSGFAGEMLRSGLVAIRDEGVFDTVSEEDDPSVEQICVGIAEPRQARTPAAVIVNPETLDVTRLPFPEFGQSFGRSAASELLGTVSSPAGDEYLLFTISDGLWSLDVSTGQWTLLEPAGDSAEDGALTAFGHAESGDRVYRVAAEITVFDLVFPGAGLIETNSTRLPIELSQGPSTRFDAGSVLYSDTERVLYRDFFLGGAVWSFTIPSLEIGG